LPDKAPFFEIFLGNSGIIGFRKSLYHVTFVMLHGVHRLKSELTKRKRANAMKKLLRSSNSGFSLVELMIAIVITVLMFSGIFATSIQSMQIMRLAREESRSIQAAQYEVEKLRTYTWYTLRQLGSSVAVNPADNAALAALVDGAATITITPFPSASSNEPTRHITVDVSWTIYNGDTHTNSIIGMISEEGMSLTE
jgi:prepilin-type N-terminal cleavage/methylation domain-containing protein